MIVGFRLNLTLFIAVCLLWAGNVQPVVAEEAVPDPSTWSSLSGAQFAQQLRSAWDANEKEPKVTRKRISDEAVRRLAETDAVNTDDLETLDRLTRWAGKKYTDDKRAQVQARWKPREFDTVNEPCNHLIWYGDVLARLQVDEARMGSLVRDWVDHHPPTDLSAKQLEWLCKQLTDVPQSGDTIQVEWKGFLKPSEGGNYVLTLAESQSDCLYVASYVTTMKVWIGDQLVLNSQEDWHRPSPAQTFAAGQTYPIRIEFSHYRRPDFADFPGAPGMAMLYWESATVKRELIPSAALVPPSQQGSGLEGTYRLTQPNLDTGHADVTLQVTRIDPQIEFEWLRVTSHALSENRKRQLPLVGALHKLYCSTEYLDARCKPINDASHYNLEDWQTSIPLMTSAQRQSLTEAIMAHPRYLQGMILRSFLRTYELLYPGNEVTALQMVRMWLHQHPEVVLKLGKTFYESDRRIWMLAEPTAHRPQGYYYARDQIAPRDDGGCCFSGAVYVTYLAKMTGSMDDWMQFLDHRLSDPGLTGDHRAEWLLARGFGDAIRQTELKESEGFLEYSEFGQPDLQEAYQVAQDEKLKLLATELLVNRRLLMKTPSEAGPIMEQAERDLTSEASRAGLAKIKETLMGFKVEIAKGSGNTDQHDPNKYLETLKWRMKELQATHDDGLTEKYTRLIEKLEGQKP